MIGHWKTLPFDEVLFDATSGNLKTLASDFLPEGQYPIVDQGKGVIAGYTNDPSRLCAADLPVIVFGDHTRAVKFIDFSFCLGADGTKVLKPKTAMIQNISIITSIISTCLTQGTADTLSSLNGSTFL